VRRAAILFAGWSVPGLLTALQVWLLTIDEPDPLGVYLACAVYYYPVLDVPVARPDLPVLLVRTGIDGRGILDSIETWLAAAVAANARVEVVNLPRHQHGFDGRDDDDESRRVIRATVGFFARHLGARRP
jgi:dienelactone hydrolase